MGKGPRAGASPLAAGRPNGGMAAPSPDLLRPLRPEAVDSYIHQLQKGRRVGAVLAARPHTATAGPVAVGGVGAKRPGVALQENAARLLREAQKAQERQRERASLREEVEAEEGYYFSDEDNDA